MFDVARFHPGLVGVNVSHDQWLIIGWSVPPWGTNFSHDLIVLIICVCVCVCRSDSNLYNADIAPLDF